MKQIPGVISSWLVRRLENAFLVVAVFLVSGRRRQWQATSASHVEILYCQSTCFGVGIEVDLQIAKRSQMKEHQVRKKGEGNLQGRVVGRRRTFYTSIWRSSWRYPLGKSRTGGTGRRETPAAFLIRFSLWGKLKKPKMTTELDDEFCQKKAASHYIDLIIDWLLDWWEQNWLLNPPFKVFAACAHLSFHLSMIHHRTINSLIRPSQFQRNDR